MKYQAFIALTPGPSPACGRGESQNKPVRHTSTVECGYARYGYLFTLNLLNQSFQINNKRIYSNNFIIYYNMDNNKFFDNKINIER